MLLKHVSTAFSENNKTFKKTGAKFNQLMENAGGTYSTQTLQKYSGLGFITVPPFLGLI